MCPMITCPPTVSDLPGQQMIMDLMHDKLNKTQVVRGAIFDLLTCQEGDEYRELNNDVLMQWGGVLHALL